MEAGTMEGIMEAGTMEEITEAQGGVVGMGVVGAAMEAVEAAVVVVIECVCDRLEMGGAIFETVCSVQCK